jgi:hypothetical protein
MATTNVPPQLDKLPPELKGKIQELRSLYAEGSVPAMRGSRSGSVTRGSKRSAFRSSPCKAFPRHSAPGWLPVRSSFAILE